MQTDDCASIYLNVVDPINAEYAQLRRYLRVKDTRAFRLLDFETSLSAALPDMPLAAYTEWQDARRRIDLDRADPWACLDYSTFRWQIGIYEVIMRRAGLIGTRRRAEDYASKYFRDAEGGE